MNFIPLRNKADDRYDYIVIGAGSAGCVIAARLAEDSGARVLLLEAGGNDKKLSIKMPSAFYMPLNDKRINWGYYSEAEPHLDNRKIHCPRGKVLGGSSSINGMVYIRGNREDFDGWDRLGASGWDYESVLPYFRKSQRADDTNSPHPYKGHDGPLVTTKGLMENPLYSIFLDAAQSAGYPLNPDVNGESQEGFGPMPMTVDSGVRASTYFAYIDKPQSRKNLIVIPRATTQEIIIKNNKAIGVRYIRKKRSVTALADAEVILCAGAVNSPQILMLSGIGNAEDLDRLQIKTKLHLPGVGQNLMDHLEVYVQQACLSPISLHKHLDLIGKSRIGVGWLFNQKGLGATNHFEVGGFIKSKNQQVYPDIQFHFLPVAMSYDGKTKASQHGFQVHVGPMLSKSRGSVSLKSGDPLENPEIRFNYMSHAEDFSVFRDAIRAARKIFRQKQFDDIRGEELNPGDRFQSDEDLDSFIRKNAESAYHPCGTCRMGGDEMSVVDPSGKVHGVDNLRVADSSIFPKITNGNLNAPTIMVAERIADFIKSG
ncbi:MAG: choline dehydrogenase [Gammaproteobacteria bacterium]|nr:choline dehydrogenase [Gammaproteobacteria bacterium]